MFMCQVLYSFERIQRSRKSSGVLVCVCQFVLTDVRLHHGNDRHDGKTPSNAEVIKWVEPPGSNQPVRCRG